MSRIYFHAQNHDEVILSGSERAYMSNVINDMMLGALGDLTYAEKWLKSLIRPDHYLHQYTGEEFANSCEVFLRVAWGEKLMLPSGPIDPFTIALNTAYSMNDQLKLFARLHGQCELHCWMEGETDKKWIANIIKKGLKNGLMRKDEGWEDVETLLREDGDFPVVCSFSVGEQFPNLNCLPKNHPLLRDAQDEEKEIDAYDKFYEMDEDKKWKLCMKGLRASGGGIQITKKNWNDFYFGDDRIITAFNLAKYAQKIA
jgi:hypothetical protein